MPLVSFALCYNGSIRDPSQHLRQNSAAHAVLTCLIRIADVIRKTYFNVTSIESQPLSDFAPIPLPPRSLVMKLGSVEYRQNIKLYCLPQQLPAEDILRI